MARKIPQFPDVTVDDSGFQLVKGHHEVLEVSWSDIVEIAAFKGDHWAYDVICLGFRRNGADDFIEVTEDFPGYAEFIKFVEARFKLGENWWPDVAFPAFATNWSTIWKSHIQG